MEVSLSFDGETHPSRFFHKNPKMKRFKSWDPSTPFAPYFDIPIFLDTCGSTITSDLNDFIHGMELGDYESSNGWTTYNIFDSDDLIVKVLCDKIYQVYEEYVTELEDEVIPKDKLWIRGWAVRLEEGQQIKHHSHAFHENTFISGNISLSDLDTTTDYYFPYLGWYFGYYKIQNTPGKMAMFPSWLEHKVDPNTTGEVRYSLGFDMFTEHTINYIGENRNENEEFTKVILLSKRMDEI